MDIGESNGVGALAALAGRCSKDLQDVFKWTGTALKKMPLSVSVKHVIVYTVYIYILIKEHFMTCQCQSVLSSLELQAIVQCISMSRCTLEAFQRYHMGMCQNLSCNHATVKRDDPLTTYLGFTRLLRF